MLAALILEKVGGMSLTKIPGCFHLEADVPV